MLKTLVAMFVLFCGAALITSAWAPEFGAQVFGFAGPVPITGTLVMGLIAAFILRPRDN